MRRNHSEVTDPNEIQRIQNKSEEDRRVVAEYLYKRNQPGDRETVAAMGFQFKDE